MQEACQDGLFFRARLDAPGPVGQKVTILHKHLAWIAACP